MSIIAAFEHEFRRHRHMLQQALQPLSDEQFFHRPTDSVNSIALIVKHLTGNIASRWTDFLTTDGDKPWRDRDSEFVRGQEDTRAYLEAALQRSFATLEHELGQLKDADLERTVTIRQEPHTVFQAVLRNIDHLAYHTGQILYLARMLAPTAPWLTIAPGASKVHRPGYLKSQ